jgi:hypothetical protein
MNECMKADIALVVDAGDEVTATHRTAHTCLYVSIPLAVSPSLRLCMSLYLCV